VAVNARRVGAILGHEAGYAERMRAGLQHYARTRQRWVVRWGTSGRGLAMLRDWGAEGLVVLAGSADQATRIAASGVPVVNVSNRSRTGLPAVHADDTAVGRVAAEHLLGLGLRHFAYAGTDRCRFNDQRQAGFGGRLADAGFGVAVLDRTAYAAADFRALDRMFADWLAGLPRPVGVMVSEDTTGERLLYACLEAGIDVPGEVAVVSVNDHATLCEATPPPMSSIDIPFERIGFEAGRMLDRLMGGRPVPDREVLIPPGEVTVRRSSAFVAVDDPVVRRAVRQIEQRVGEGLNIDDLLGDLRVSRRSLERRFREALGVTPFVHLQRVRQRRVRELLADTDLPMSDVAAAAGYTDQNRMGIAFRRENGQTPTAYRRQHRLR